MSPHEAKYRYRDQRLTRDSDGVKEQPPDRDQMPSFEGLDGTRQPCFVIATKHATRVEPRPAPRGTQGG